MVILGMSKASPIDTGLHRKIPLMFDARAYSLQVGPFARTLQDRAQKSLLPEDLASRGRVIHLPSC